MNETFFLYLACILYAPCFFLSYLDRRQWAWRWTVVFAIAGLSAQSLSLALRWQRVGHGPFINLFEILHSNLWSLMLAFLIFMLVAPRHRGAARYLVPLLALLMAWLLLTAPRDTHLPPTYDTPWLYFHVFSGKLFLGLLMLACAVAIDECRRGADGAQPAGRALSYRLLAFAFCFESLMLVFGAIWAQDAWGRYWAWDPLETWAFMTWLSVILVLHWRLNYDRQRVYAILVGGCFVLAFLTFFGVPFVSTAPHKGMI